VLCPRGPLRVLVETAQERDEPIPALVYNASVWMLMMQGDASEGSGSGSGSAGGDSLEMKALADGDEEPKVKLDDPDASNLIEPLNPVTQEQDGGAPSTGAEQEEPPLNSSSGVKLGLGDFIFYSVLVGRASLFDMLTVVASFIGIVTGLFCTIMLLAVWRKALPALPISIFFGVIFFFLTKFFLHPFTSTLIANGAIL